MNKKAIIFLAIAVLVAGYFYMARCSESSSTAAATASTVAASASSNQATSERKDNLDMHRPPALNTSKEELDDAKDDIVSASVTPIAGSAPSTPCIGSASSTPPPAKNEKEKAQVDQKNENSSEAFNSAIANAPWNQNNK